MSKTLVTGGTGFLGNHLVRALASDKNEILYTFRSQALEGVDATGIALDLGSTDDLARHAPILKEVTHLVHAAATVTHNQGDILQDLHTHITLSVEGFRRLMEKLPNLERIVYVSSCSAAMADADPTFYGPGKLLMEGVVKRIATARAIPYVNLRFPQLFGPGEPHGIFITKFLEALRAKKEIQLVNNGSVTKDILYIDDAVGSIQRALQSDVPAGLYTVTMPEATTIREVLDVLSQTTNLEPIVKHSSISDEEMRAKSFHFPSSASAMGYRLRYNVQQGIEALVEDINV